MAPIETLLALVASTIFLIRLLPQPFRLARTGVAAGVSAVAALNALVSDGAWLAYGLSAGLPVVWMVSIAAMVPGLWTVVLLRRDTRASDGIAAAAVLAVLGLAAVADVFAVALALTVIVTSGPQVWKAIRDRDLSGLAPATWWVAIADGLAWGSYGVVVHDPALQGYCVVLVTSAVIVLVRIRWTIAPVAINDRASGGAAPAPAAPPPT
ncbi:MAG: hypothetical protein ACYDH6_11620 [Acidimicrobiales bacterium]